ncbi:MAG: peptidoglycan DD-metalloendopeptidase family protein [Stappiaceae bacterium]
MRTRSTILAVAASFMLQGSPMLASENTDSDSIELSSEENRIEQERLKRKDKHKRDLELLTRDIKLGNEKQDEIEREIRSLDRDRKSLNGELLKTAQRIRNLEVEIEQTQGRLLQLKDNEDAVRQSLNDRKAVLSEVLMALQRIGKRPPPALAVRPKDALSAVRSAILLNAVMPEIRTEAEALAADLTELTRLHASIEKESGRLQSDARRMTEESVRVEILIGEKRREIAQSEETLANELRRAQELAEQATSLSELIGQIEEEIESARKAAVDARDASQRKREKERGIPDNPFADNNRLTPAISFANARGKLPKPVSGTLLQDFGDEDGFGGTASGQSLAASSGAIVTAPNDGWIVFAGEFRSYGQLLILNAGDGYHVLIAGMDRIDVQLGQFVLTGEPIGRMGTKQLASAANVALGWEQPVLYIEFRKNDSPINPQPWWAETEDKKVRG